VLSTLHNVHLKTRGIDLISVDQLVLSDRFDGVELARSWQLA